MVTTRPSTKIVGAFLRAALGPVQYAAGLIMSNKVKEGLSELAPEPLDGALRRGIADVAKLASLSVTDVESELPMRAYADALATLKKAHPEALSAWDLHAGPTGFLSAITALTIDGRKPEIGLSIERVAKKLARDKGLVGPLLALAGAINAWEELISQSVDVLEKGAWLSRALLKKRLRTGAIVAVPLIVATALGVFGSRVLSARSRVDARLANADPCLQKDVPADDRKFSSSSQDAKIAAADKACTDKRAAEAEAARVAEEARLAKEAADAAVKAHFDACSRVATAVKDGSYPNLDQGNVVPEAQRGLLERIAKHALTVDDLGPKPITFPCGDTAFAQDFEGAYEKTVVAMPELWPSLESPSPKTIELIKANKSALNFNVIESMTKSADQAATKALTSGDHEAMARAKRICDVARLVFDGELRYCASIDKFLN